MTSKSTSAGVIITDGINLLICHVTGTVRWDLPKGGVDEGETDIEAAVRELREETSLIVEPTQLVPLGTFSYNKRKNLSLFLYKVDTMPDPQSLYCKSTFISSKGYTRMEMDGYVNAKWSEIHTWVTSDMLAVLLQVKPHIV